MPNQIRKIETREVDEEHQLVVDLNVDIPLKEVRGHTAGLVRGNVYRNKEASDKGAKQPVLVTYAPYGKDVPYSSFNKRSYDELPEGQKSKWSAWEVPEPTYWTKHGYTLLRVDERGFGQSPGFADSMSSQTASDFAQVIEWAAEQPWCNGRVGLLGISYYGGSQWRVAALRPKGLTCMLPWEGMSDYYRDRTRHGGILSNKFVDFWWYRQLEPNLYGTPGRAARNWGPDTIEGDLTPEEIKANHTAQPEDLPKHQFLDDPYYASRDYDLADIEVPCLSVANWGGIMLHLRGNVVGYTEAGSKQKWLRFITGRHDIPFYLPEFVAVQRSFLDAFLLDDDREGWKEGKVSPVNVCVREGNPGFNDTEAERTYRFRDESAWPLPNTQYSKWHLSAEGKLGPSVQATSQTVSYPALGAGGEQSILKFSTEPMTEKTEITGHIVARLTVGVAGTPAPRDLDLFVTLRHFDSDNQQVFYTGTAGDPVPLCKGWLRCSLRKLDSKHPQHRDYLPRRAYLQADQAFLSPNTEYAVDVEVWPTNVVLSKGARLEFEVSSADTQGGGIFLHTLESDRSQDIFGGSNELHFGEGKDNYLLLPIIPQNPSAKLTSNPFASASIEKPNGITNGHVNGTSRPLKVIIVGGGLGGLACGAAMREFANVTIFESAAEIKEIGAAVHLAPNAHRIIKGLGADLAKRGCVPVRAFREWSKGAEITIDRALNPLESHGCEWMLCHRVDLQNELLDLATREDGPGKPCKLSLGEQVVSCDPEFGSVTLKNGMMVTADVIIGADGIRSTIRNAVLDTKYIAQPSKHSAYRMLVPASKIMAEPELKDLGLLEQRITIIHDNERRIICYPCRNATLLNFVCALPDSELNEISEETWTARGSTESLVKSFDSFSPVWQKLLSLGEKPGLWQLRDQDPLPQWVKGKTIIVGDAAHPMLPHQGQGASGAIEDAEALAHYLRGVKPKDVNTALRNVFDTRYKRVSYIQQLSRASGLGEMRRQNLAKNGLAELPETLNPMQFSAFCWEYYGAERWAKDHPDWVLAH